MEFVALLDQFIKSHLFMIQTTVVIIFLLHAVRDDKAIKTLFICV